jgi:hypothetical protein
MNSRSVRSLAAVMSLLGLAGCAAVSDAVAPVSPPPPLAAPPPAMASRPATRAARVPTPPLPGAIPAVAARPAGPGSGADADGDGIADADDACPGEPEVFNGFDDEDGCPDHGRVVITQNNIVIVDRGPVAEPPDSDADAIPDADDGRGADADPAAGAPAVITRVELIRPQGVGEVQGPRPARLTAAAVADVDRRGAYQEYLGRHETEAAELGLDLSRRVRFRLVDRDGRPVHDAALTLNGSGFQVAGRTRADGSWDVFPGVVGPQVAGLASLAIQVGGEAAQVQVEIPAGGDAPDVAIRLDRVRSAAPRALDLAFMIDSTGSMGDESAYVRQEVASIVRRVRAAVPDAEVRVGATFYRDRGDEIPLEQIPFTADVEGFVGLMERVEAGGGGDYPEDMNAGLAAALETLAWREGPAVRVLVLIADAPPQPYADFPYTYRDAMIEASARGIRLIPVAASGADRVVEYLFRAIGAFTGTPYVYLTDESGVGGHHLEADTDRIAVEMFSDLLTRLLVSDLRGQGMHEPVAL